MPMKVLVIGAHGKTGFRVVQRLKESEHAPLAMIRDVQQRPAFDALGVPTVLGDLEYPIDHAVAECDAVIFAAGSGSKTGKDKTVLIDHLGAIRSMVTAAVHGASRYVMLSSIGAVPDSTSRIQHYHRAKAAADAFLRTHDEVLPEDQRLAWTIICPGGLTEEAATERVEVGGDLNVTAQTSRANLAAALVACLDEPATVGQQFTLLDGDTPLSEALRRVG